MLDDRWAIVSAAILLIGTAKYAYETWRGRTQPNLVTWGLWGLAPAVALAAQLASGVGPEALLTFAIAFGPVMVVAAALARRHALWKPTAFDLVCGSVSLLALILWRVTGEGAVAIAFALLADFMAATPTLVKAYRRPETEDAWAFWTGVVGSIINLLVIDVLSFESAGVTVYVLVVNLVLAVLISFPKFARASR